MLIFRASGDVVNVIGEFTVPVGPSAPLPTVAVSSKANWFIHHPDLLITATSLSSAPQCRRKPLISNLVRGTVDATPSLVWGNMLHEVMQECLRSGRWDDKWVEELIANEVGKGLGELMRVNVTVEQAMSEMKARARGIKSFAEKYISQVPKVISFSAIPCDCELTRTLSEPGSPHKHPLKSESDVLVGDFQNARYRGGHLVADVRAKGQSRRFRKRCGLRVGQLV